jgi:hypothetical protein
MPKVLLFVPCEKVGYDASDQAAVLTGIFQGFTISMIDQPIFTPSTVSILPINRSNADASGERAGGSAPQLIPLKWVVFALYRFAENETGKKYVQLCELVKPDGTVFMSSETTIDVKARFHRNTINVVGFPTDQAGDYNLRLSLAEEGNVLEFKQDYPISVSFTEPEEQQ